MSPPRTFGPHIGPRRLGSSAGEDTVPRVLSVAPTSDRIAGGIAVTITGKNFKVDGAGTLPVVAFGGVQATSVVVVSDSTITCVDPARTEAGLVDIRVDVGTQHGSRNALFTYVAGSISEIIPNHALITGAVPVTLIGVNFLAGSTITFNGVAATGVNFVDTQTYVAIVPASVQGAGAVTVRIIEPSAVVVSATRLFRYTSVLPVGDIRRSPSITIRDALNNAPNTASFIVDGFSSPPSVGTAVEFTDDGQIIFSGVVQRGEQTYEDAITNIAWPVTAVDHTYMFNRKRPFGTYDNQSISDIAIDLVHRYAQGFTVNHVQTNLARVSLVLDGTKDLSTVLSYLCQAIGEAHWYLDYTRDLHLFHLPLTISIEGSLEPPASTIAPGAPLPAMTVSTSTVRQTGAMPPGYYYFRTTGKYGGVPTYGTPLVSAPIGASGNQYVLLSNEAAALNNTGAVSNGTYAENNGVGIPNAPTQHPSQPLSLPCTGFAPNQQIWIALTAVGLYGGESTRGPAFGPFTLLPSTSASGPNLVMPASGSRVASLSMYMSIDGVTYGRIQTNIVNTSSVPVVVSQSEFLQALNVPPPTVDASNVYYTRGWVGYNGVTQLQITNLVAPGGNVVYFASADVAAGLERPSNSQFETALSPISNALLIQDFVPTFTNIPVYPAISGFACQSRKIFFVRIGEDGTATTGYLTINDNTTTTLTAEFSIFHDVPTIAKTNPPIGAVGAPTAFETTTPIVATEFLGGVAAQQGYYSFKVSGVYQDGSESYPTDESNVILVGGLYKVEIDFIPIFPDVNGVPCVFRKVYACVFTPVLPLKLGIPTWKTANLIAIILENTSVSLTTPIGRRMTGGDSDSNNPLGYPVGTPSPLVNTDGPWLEDASTPEDLTDVSTLMLRDSPLRSSEDISQIRNRVYVKGKGTILTSDAVKGATRVNVADVSMFSPQGGQFINGSKVRTYSSIDSTFGNSALILPTPLTEDILQADWKFGGGTPVRPFVQINDRKSQRQRGKVELDPITLLPGDGIHEDTVDDDSLATTEQCITRGLATLQLFSRPITTITYSTRDPKTRSGKIVHVDLTNPPLFGDFIIQEVTIDQIHDENDSLTPRYTATADSAARFNFNDLLLYLDDRAGKGGIPSDGNTAVTLTGGSAAVRTAQGYAAAASGTPLAKGIGCADGVLVGATFDAVEIPPFADYRGFNPDRSWITLASSTAPDNVSTMTFSPIPGTFLEEGIDLFMHVKTPVNLGTGIILWAGLFQGTPPATISGVNTSICAIRYANYSGGTNTIDPGWVGVLQPDGVSHTQTVVPITAIAPSTDYFLQIQSSRPSDFQSTKVTFTVNGVSASRTFLETANPTGSSSNWDMPTSAALTANGPASFIVAFGVANKTTLVRKFNFRRFTCSTK